MPSPDDTPNTLAKWSGLGFQMLVAIGGGTYLGYKLDAWTTMKFPLWTLVLSLTGVVLSIVLVYREVMAGE